MNLSTGHCTAIWYFDRWHMFGIAMSINLLYLVIIFITQKNFKMKWRSKWRHMKLKFKREERINFFTIRFLFKWSSKNPIFQQHILDKWMNSIEILLPWKMRTLSPMNELPFYRYQEQSCLLLFMSKNSAFIFFNSIDDVNPFILGEAKYSNTFSADGQIFCNHFGKLNWNHIN